MTTELNRLYAENLFEWIDVSDWPKERLAAVLPESTYLYVDQWLVGTNHGFRMHREPVDGVYVFRVISNKLVEYLIHDPVSESHMWGDKRFENLDNNRALVALSKDFGRRMGLTDADLLALFNALDNGQGFRHPLLGR